MKITPPGGNINRDIVEKIKSPARNASTKAALPRSVQEAFGTFHISIVLLDRLFTLERGRQEPVNTERRVRLIKPGPLSRRLTTGCPRSYDHHVIKMPEVTEIILGGGVFSGWMKIPQH